MLKASSGYWKVKTKDVDKENTACKIHHGLYRLTDMSFDVPNTMGR